MKDWTLRHFQKYYAFVALKLDTIECKATEYGISIDDTFKYDRHCICKDNKNSIECFKILYNIYIWHQQPVLKHISSSNVDNEDSISRHFGIYLIVYVSECRVVLPLFVIGDTSKNTYEQWEKQSKTFDHNREQRISCQTSY